MTSILSLTKQQRIQVLSNWTNQRRGRTIKLARALYPNWTENSQATIISQVKYKKYNLSDEMWSKLQNEMARIEMEETEMVNETKPLLSKSYEKVKEQLQDIRVLKEFKKFIGIDEFTPSMIANKTAVVHNFEHFELSKTDKSIKSQNFIVTQWLKTDKKLKLRLANVVYSVNFAKNAKDNLNDRRFTRSIGKVVMTNSEFDRIMKVMNKVDQLIESNSPFANAAKLAK